MKNFLLILLLLPFLGFSQVDLVQWNGSTDLVPTILNNNIIASNVTGAGITGPTPDYDGITGTGWPTANTIDTGKYFQITLNPILDGAVVLNEIRFTYKGTYNSFQVRYSKAADFSSPTTLTTVNNAASNNSPTVVSLTNPISVNAGEKIYIRFYAYNGSGNWKLMNNNLLKLRGTITPPSKMSGTYVVGSATGASFPTITTAVNALITAGAQGDVKFLLDNTVYNTSTNESFPIVINPYTGNNLYKVTFKPNTGKTVTVSASNTSNTVSAVFKLNGVDRVVFDGSNTENGATKDLTLYNTTTSTNSSNSRAVIWIASENSINGSTNNEIKNIVLKQHNKGGASDYSIGIFAGGNSSVASVAEAANSYTTVTNVEFNKVGQAIYVYGNTSLLSSNWYVKGNTIGNTSTDNTAKPYVAVNFMNVKDYEVSNNIIDGLINDINSIISSTHAAIWIDGKSNGSIYNNNIANIWNSNFNSIPDSRGIYINSSNNFIYNNFISNVYSSANYSKSSGIYINSGSTNKIYYNTIVMNNNSNPSGSSCLHINGGSNLDIKNNIFYNSQTTGSQYAVYSNVANSAFSSIDNNDYYASTIGYLGSARTTLTNWQAATTKDVNSISVAPTFVSATDLHLQNVVANSTKLNKGTSISGITTDIDGNNRSATVPYIGADEIACILPEITTQPISQLDCEGASVNFSVIATGTGLTYNWQRKKPTDAGFITIPVEGNVSYPSTGKIKIDNAGSAQSPSGTQYQVVITNSSGCSVTSAAATLLVNEITDISSPPLTPSQSVMDVTLCNGANYWYTATTSTPPPGSVISYQWKSSVASGSWNNVVDGAHFSGAKTATLNIINGTPAQSAEYKVQVIFTSSGANCNVTTTLTRKITFLPEVTAPVASPTQPDCITSTGSVTLSGLPVGGKVNPGNITYSGTTCTITGLAPGASYSYTVTLGSCTSAPSNTITINDITPAIWNGTSWLNGIQPNATKALIFSGSYTSVDNLTACSVTVNAGASVTIKSGHALTITNGLTVASTGAMTFEDSASLVQINNVPNSGSITYKRNSTGGELDYTYWSSPVKSQKLYDVSPLTKLDKFYSYNSAIKNWAGENPLTTTMIVGKGYIIRGIAPPPPPASPPGFYTAVFKGVPNNGDLSIEVVGGEVSNLIGNPYPSSIDADQFLIENQLVIGGKIAFWTHNTGIQLASNITGTAGSGAFAYTSDDYASYNITGGVATKGKSAASTSGGGSIPNGQIAAGQSFFTTSTVAGGTLKFNNAMRSNGSGTPLNNSTFYKTSSPSTKKTTKSIEKNRVWLNLSNTQGAFKQTLLGYITGATNENDALFDGKTSDGNKYLDFYTVNKDKNLTIQGRALPFDENDEVPLGYRTTINGDFTINIDQTDGLLNDKPIYIEDKLNNTVFNLKTGNFTFNTSAGTFNNRFVLKYSNNKTLDLETVTQQDGILVFYSNNYKMLIIQNSELSATIQSADLYSMTGQKIDSWNLKDNEQSNIQIPIKNISRGIYIVKVKSDKGESTKKIIVN